MFIKQYTSVYYHHSERDAIRLFADGYMVVFNLDRALDMDDGMYSVSFPKSSKGIEVNFDFAPFEHWPFRDRIDIILNNSQKARIEGFMAFPLRPETPGAKKVLCERLKVRKYLATWYQPGVGMISCEFTPMDRLKTSDKYSKLLESYLYDNMSELVKMEVYDAVSFTVDPEDERTKGIIIRRF